jgi:hypothetical protein
MRVTYVSASQRTLIIGTFSLASFCSLVSLRIFPSIQQQCYALSFDSRGHGKVHFFYLPTVQLEVRHIGTASSSQQSRIEAFYIKR